MAMFEARLAAAAARVETRLAAILDAEAGDTPPRLVEAMRHAVLGGGKRFRPFLVLETAAMLGSDHDGIVDVAAALELVHCYSLVHDDLPAMDNDELRRGRPTVWKAFDDWTAILTGDALLTLAFEVVAAAASGLPPDAGFEITRRLARAAGPRGMVGGQMLDLEADKLGRPAAPTTAHIARLQAMKTGALIVFACEAGGIAAGAGNEERAALAVYGRALGAAFQLSDDLLDVTGDEAAVGKAVGKDAAAGKATLVSAMGMDRSRQRLGELVAEALDAVQPWGPRAENLAAAAHFMAARDR